MGVKPGGNALDLACGSGRHSLYLLARGHGVTACDIDQQLEAEGLAGGSIAAA